MSNATVKILLTVCAVILIAAVLVCFTDIFRFTGYSYAEAEKYTAGGTEITGTVRNLDIDWVNGKVKISYQSGNTVSVSETSDKPISGDFQLRWLLDGDTLRIRYAKDGFRQIGWNNQQKELTLTLPEGIKLDDVKIAGTSADLILPSLQAENLTMTTTSGDINAAAVSAAAITGTSTSGNLALTVSEDARDIRATSTSGSIRIKAKSAERLHVVSTSGSISITAEIVGELRTTSTSGTVLATMDSLADGQISSTSGNITVSAKAVSQLKVSATSGSVSASLPAEPGFTAHLKTTSGRLDYTIPLTRNGSNASEYVCGDGSGKVSINTTSGDVRIDSV